MIFPLFFIFIIFITFYIGWNSLTPQLKFSFFMYGGAYTITTLVGGTLIGLISNHFALNILESYGINVALIARKFDFGYWVLLYGPLIIPLWVILAINQCLSRTLTLKWPILNQSVSLMSFWFVFLFFLIYFAIKLFDFVLSDNFLNLINNHNYQSSILFRRQLIVQLRSTFFGLAYSTMPTFSHVALYQWSKTKSRLWLFTFLISALTITCIYLIIVLKGMLLIYLVSIAFGLYFLKIIKKLNFVILMGCSVLLLITLYQSLFNNNWHFLDSIYLILFRGSSSFPFYYSLYPKVLPFSGLHIMSTDNLDVFNYMYQGVDWTIGSVSAPSQLIAYSQGGFILALSILILTGFFIYIISLIGSQIRGPLRYALFMQALVFLYYLTQTSVQAAFITSYGIIWALFGIGILFVCSNIFSKALVQR